MDPNNPAETAEGRFRELESDRMPFLDQAQQCAKYTLPWAYPPPGTAKGADLYKPYTSIGARGVNSLTSAFAITMLPPGGSFVRLHADEKITRGLEEQDKQAIDNALSLYEQAIVREVESRYVRVIYHEAVRHLLIGGNCVLYFPHDSDTVRVFSLESFVCRRSSNGTLLELIIKEGVAPSDLPEATRQTVENKLKTTADRGQKNLDLYTWIKLEGDRYTVTQECSGVTVEGSKGSYPRKKLPWLAMRWSRISGESYGRGHCADYLGDLIAADKLSQAILEMAALASRSIPLINPNGMTNRDEFLHAKNGQPIDGHKDDVTWSTTEKLGDLQIAKAALDDIEQRLSYAFILSNAIQRQAERVTAEEIRLMAQQLEQQLGGAYSLQNQEFQLPLVELATAALEMSGRMPVLPEGAVRHTIVTGVDALGRSQDLAKLRVFISANAEISPNAASTLKQSSIQKKIAAAIGLDPHELVMSDEEIADAQNQAVAQSLTEKIAPQAISQIGQSQRAAMTTGPTPSV